MSGPFVPQAMLPIGDATAARRQVLTRRIQLFVAATMTYNVLERW